MAARSRLIGVGNTNRLDGAVERILYILLPAAAAAAAILQLRVMVRSQSATSGVFSHAVLKRIFQSVCGNYRPAVVAAVAHPTRPYSRAVRTFMILREHDEPAGTTSPEGSEKIMIIIIK